MLELDNSKADLSRRQTIYTLNGLSFREYLEYEGIYTCENIDFHHLLENHVNYAMKISGKIKVLKFFESYLKKGYYPYYKKIGPDYYMRINEVVRLVIESDLPSVENIAYSTVKKTEKLLMIIAKSVPFIPNINSLCGQVELTRDMCLRSLYALDKAGLLNLLTDEIKNYKQLSKPEKIYLANTDLMYALSSDVSVGNIRETFFAEQVSSKYPLALSHKGDFKVNDNYHFEVGGKKKNFDQIADMDNGYLAVDDTEIGYGHRIPLWMFGMLY
jgi:predicted AAA+ superfamily ATPase